jgi:hypothetical protein
MQKLSHKSCVMVYKSCKVLHKETNKIGFTLFWVIFEFLWILQVTSQNTLKGKNLFTHRSLETFGLHKNTLASSNQALAHENLYNGALRRWSGAHRQWCGTRAGKQMNLGCDWAHPWPIGSGALAGDVAGEQRRRSSGSAAAMLKFRRGEGLH